VDALLAKRPGTGPWRSFWVYRPGYEFELSVPSESRLVRVLYLLTTQDLEWAFEWARRLWRGEVVRIEGELLMMPGVPAKREPSRRRRGKR
jgi:hypothetical protein